MGYKIGDKSKFAFAKGEPITNIQDVDFEYIMESIFVTCPQCGWVLGEKKPVRIKNLVSISDGNYYVGYSNENLTLKLQKKDIPVKWQK